MQAHDVIRQVIEMGNTVGMGYLSDLTDDDLLQRPDPGCNHVNWQVGHLIVSENHSINQAVPDSMPPLPAGFAEKYSPSTAGRDDLSAFATKAELMETLQQQRAATLNVLGTLSAEDLDKATGISYAPTVSSLFTLQGTHWLMHAGQWVVVRRQLGHAPLF